MVANAARGELNRDSNVSLCLSAPEKLVARDGFDRLVPASFYVLHSGRIWCLHKSSSLSVTAS